MVVVFTGGIGRMVMGIKAVPVLTKRSGRRREKKEDRWMITAPSKKHDSFCFLCLQSISNAGMLCPFALFFLL